MHNINKEINEKGYAIIKQLFSKKNTKDIFKSYEKNLDYCIGLVNLNKKKFNSIDEKYLYLEKKNKKLKGRSYDLSKYHPSIYNFALNKKLDRILKKYFKEEYYIDLPQIRADDNKNSFILPPHQEIFGQISSKLITLWAPLTNVSKQNGTLGVVEGSHKKGLMKHIFYKINKNTYHGVDKKILKKAKYKYLNLKAGDAVLFHPLLIHTSIKNLSNKIRWTFIARYNGITGIEYLKNLNAPLRIEQKV